MDAQTTQASMAAACNAAYKHSVVLLWAQSEGRYARAYHLDELKKAIADAASLLGFTLTPIINSTGDTPATDTAQSDIPETTLSDIRDQARKVHNTDGKWLADGGDYVAAPNHILSTADGTPQNMPSAPHESHLPTLNGVPQDVPLAQDICSQSPSYSHGLSGRLSA